MSIIRKHLSRAICLVLLFALSLEISATVLAYFVDNDKELKAVILEKEEKRESTKELDVFFEILFSKILTVYSPDLPYFSWVQHCAEQFVSSIHCKESRVAISIPHPQYYLLFHNFKVYPLA